VSVAQPMGRHIPGEAIAFRQQLLPELLRVPSTGGLRDGVVGRPSAVTPGETDEAHAHLPPRCT
jgi:hypothetical protein